MADYNIKADITANTKGYEAGIKKAQESTKKFSTSLSKVIQGLGKNGLVGAMGSIGLASAGLSATLGAVVKIAKQVSQAIGECTEAYKKQLIAERQLETAINNNPLVTGSAKKRLTEFANEMQKVSNYGDEELIPMMANLVSLGRTEEETMKIMSVAMDMSASGSMSLDTAINQLNATLNGNIGRLGQQNAELKGLTEEELKSGKAVEILGEKFKGLAQSTVDTSKQLKNIKGDFKEAIGEFTLPSSDMWNKFWIGFYEKGISVIKQFDEYMDKTIIGKGIAEELIKGYKTISDERQKVLYLEDNIHALSESQIVALQKHLESTKNRNKEQEELLRKVKMEVEARKYLATVYAEMEKEEAQRQKTEEEQLAIENEIAILKGQYLEKMAEQERKWKNIKDVTGEQVTNEEKIKFYQDSLVDIMTKAGGQITTNNQLYKDQMAIIQKLQEGLEPEEKKTSDVWVEKIRQQAIERLQAEKDAYEQTVDLEKTTALQRYLVRKDYNDKIFALQKEQLLAERDKALKSVEDTANEYEEKARIVEYYNNELSALAKQQKITMETEGKKAGKSFAQGFSIALEGVKKVFNSIKGIIKNATGILSKLFEFNPDTALDNLLVIEDKILTFFVETLPKLPSFVASALQSIGVLIQNIMSSGGFENLWTIFENIFDMVWEGIEWLIKQITANIPKIIKMVSSVIKKIAQKIPTLISLIIPAITTLISEVVKAIPQLLNMILPVLLQSVLELVKALMQNLPQIISAIVEFLPDLIFGVTTAIADFIANLKAEDFVAIVGGVIKAIATLGVSLVKAIPQILEGLWELAKGLIKGMWNLILEALKATWKGLKWVLDLVVDWFKSTFGGYATGTNNAQKGLALVGEKGPELVDFKGGEKVYNATNTQRMLAGATSGNAGNTFNVTFNNLQDTSAYAMMSQLRQYNRQMAINGVI